MEQLSFHEQMKSNGLFARTVSVGHLGDLRKDIDVLRKDGLLDPDFYEENLTHFEYAVPKELPEARSIVVVAKPKPMLVVAFRWKGREIPLIVPPTYADGREVNAEALAALAKVSQPESYRFVPARLPLKTLAARSGLGSYGRNNIVYIPTFGSFHRLTAFFSDMPCQEDQWQEREMMPGCESCTACLLSCPTGAIHPNRMLLRAERCLTNLNEMDSSVPFPRWVDPKAHNALIGCLRCQRVCPYNKKVLSWMENREVFSEEETALLLNGTGSGEEAERLTERLKRVGLPPSVVSRNLEVLLRMKE